ncbi:hypothetical protein MUP05_07030 [Candidatus Bathyarchaeota archaeon]|jgi:hypothetical protein|nr:hypothetical protein [Candidatus Bathyarchaeota archaeon]
MGVVESWLEGLNETSRRSHKWAACAFEVWLRDKRVFKTLDEAVAFQKAAAKDERYKIVDLLVEHVKGKGGTFKGMGFRYNAARSLFLRSRAELPVIQTNWTPTRDATVGALTMEKLQVLLRSVGLREQAIYLSLLQGLLDQHRFFTYFQPKGFELGQHIKEQGTDKPFRIDMLRGRHGNPKPYNTWIGRDALEAWRLHFENERGYPGKGEAAAMDQFKKPLSKRGFYLLHMYWLKRLKLIKEPSKDSATRYGLNLHEFRDLGRSTLEKAIGEGFNPLSAEFWMGHTVDPLQYNKLWKLDPQYNLKQFKIAEKYLNILSVAPASEEVEHQKEELKKMQERLASLEKIFTEKLKIKES